MRMLSQQAMVASQMKRAANDKAIAQMLAAKKSGPPAARLGDEIQHKSFLGALAGAVLGAIVTIAEGCLIMAACATGPYALVLVPALMYASYKASDYVEEKQNQLESWINSFCDTDGAINTGSENVNINGKPAARAAVTLPPPPPPGAIPEIPQGEPSWGDIATDLLESAAEKAVPLAKAWGNAVITLTESNAGLSSSKPCVVILTEKEVEVSVNNHATFTLPKNYLAAFACNNNVIELSTLNHVLIPHINRNIINDYLLFLNKNLTCVKPWSRLATPVIACHSRTPEVFRLAANHSKQQPSKPCEAELTRALLFTVLSNFLEQSRLLPY